MGGFHPYLPHAARRRVTLHTFLHMLRSFMITSSQVTEAFEAEIEATVMTQLSYWCVTLSLIVI